MISLVNTSKPIPAAALEPEENQLDLFPEGSRYEVTQKGKIYLKRKAAYIKTANKEKSNQRRLIPNK